MAELLKNIVSEQFVARLANEIKINSPLFDTQLFIRTVTGKGWKQLELKQRLRRITETLNSQLQGSYPQKLKVLEKTAPQVRGLAGLLFPEFVELYGKEHWDLSIAALKHFTPFSSSEFAVRPFIVANPTKMLATLLQWSKDRDYHVRRLASEGCRPLLPWSFKLKDLVADPTPILPILENLKADESLYVRKSVANNLNDISKNHSELVLKLAARWKGKNPDTDWIIKHGLRTLLKKGDQRALKIFGVAGAKQVEVKDLSFAAKKFKIGDQLQFSFDLKNKAKSGQMLRLEYAIHYRKKNGTHSKKVFKIAEKNFPRGEVTITKRHSLKQMTTRVHYPGKHHLDIVVNGKVLSQGYFVLV